MLPVPVKWHSVQDQEGIRIKIYPIVNRVFFALLPIFVLLSIFIGCGSNPTEPGYKPKSYRMYDQEPAWSADGRKIAYTSGGNPNGSTRPGLYVVDLETLGREKLVEGLIYGPHWSPDGRWLAFSNAANIFKITNSGDSLTRLTDGEGEIDPRWSPDGKIICYHSMFGPGGGTFTVSVDGDSIAHLNELAFGPDWFPDGRHLAVYAHDTLLGKSGIAIYDLADESLEFLTNDEMITMHYLRVSPDGTKILFTAQLPEHSPGLFTVDVDTKEIQTITADYGYSGCWSPDGKFIAYTYPGDGAIYILDLQADTMHQVSPGIMIFHWAWDSLGFPPKGEYVW